MQYLPRRVLPFIGFICVLAILVLATSASAGGGGGMGGGGGGFGGGFGGGSGRSSSVPYSSPLYFALGYVLVPFSVVGVLWAYGQTWLHVLHVVVELRHGYDYAEKLDWFSRYYDFNTQHIAIPTRQLVHLIRK